MKQTRSAASRNGLKQVEAAAEVSPAQPAQLNGHGFIDRAFVNAELQAMRQHLGALDKQMAERAEELNNMQRQRDRLEGAIMAYEKLAKAGQVEKTKTPERVASE